MILLLEAQIQWPEGENLLEFKCEICREKYYIANSKGVDIPHRDI